MAHDDLLPDPAVTRPAPHVFVRYNDGVQGMYLGQPIKAGKSYRMEAAEAIAVLTAGHGSIVGSETAEEYEARMADLGIKNATLDLSNEEQQRRLGQLPADQQKTSKSGGKQ